MFRDTPPKQWNIASPWDPVRRRAIAAKPAYRTKQCTTPWSLSVANIGNKGPTCVHHVWKSRIVRGDVHPEPIADRLIRRGH